MTVKTILSILITIFILVACQSDPLRKRELCTEHSEWRDKNGPDSCSYYSESETCDQLYGKLEISSRLHKNAFEKDVFSGGMSSRWLVINEETIEYYSPSGDIADKGTCTCKNGKLKISWEKGENLPEEAIVYFNSPDNVELRYYDFPYSMNNFQYDKASDKINPTKIVGILK